MGFLAFLSIIVSIIFFIVSFFGWLTYSDDCSWKYNSRDKNYDLWRQHGGILTLLLTFFSILWLIGANIVICYGIYDCPNMLVSFLSISFVIIATILMFRKIDDEIGIKKSEDMDMYRRKFFFGKHNGNANI